MKKALITGIAGFAGSHLAQHLISKKIQVSGIYHPDHPAHNLKHMRGKINLIAANILEKKVLVSKMNEDFDYIFHLAAFSSPADSFKNPKETIENNLFGELNLLELLRDKHSKAKILIVGSADEYGDAEAKYLPLRETAPLAPPSPYAISKVTQDLLGLQFFLSYKLKIVRVRAFNHIGPRQSKLFAIPYFASQIALLEKQGGGTLKVGKLDALRDFTDVRDIVRAYLLALDKGKIGEVYNIGSGRLYKIGDLLAKLISFSKAKIKVEEDKSRVRKTDIKKIYANSSKFQKATGWKPKIPIEKTLFDTIEYERKNLN